jgi:hypothetical protein
MVYTAIRLNGSDICYFPPFGLCDDCYHREVSGLYIPTHHPELDAAQRVLALVKGERP